MNDIKETFWNKRRDFLIEHPQVDVGSMRRSLLRTGYEVVSRMSLELPPHFAYNGDTRQFMGHKVILDPKMPEGVIEFQNDNGCVIGRIANVV